MATAIVLSGGIGKRMNSDIPKQYILVNDKPILYYTLKKFEDCDMVDNIMIVAAPQWRDHISDLIGQYGITKFRKFSDPGENRQLSIKNALNDCFTLNIPDDEIMIIQDAVRPNTSIDLIEECIKQCYCADGVMPAIPVKDTTYFCEGSSISSLLDRSKLFSGQAPESFKFRKYLDINNNASSDLILSINGSSEIAFLSGLHVKMIEGEESNFKITTNADLDRFKEVLNS